MSAQAIAFDHLPRTPQSSFLLYLFAAIYRLVRHLHRLEEAGALDMDQVIDAYPFLGSYFAEMRAHMPRDMNWGAGGSWWQDELTKWEATATCHLPLKALTSGGGLRLESTLALMISGLVEEDSRFGTLFADLQDPLDHRRPTLELAGQIVAEDTEMGISDPWSVCRPLIDLGLVQVPNRSGPRSEWLLRVPPILWDLARGETRAKPASWATGHTPDSFPGFGAMIAPAALHDRVHRLPALIEAGITRLVVFRGVQGSNVTEIMGCVAQALGRGLIEVDATALAKAEDGGFLGALSTMANAVPLISFDLAPGETADLPATLGYDGPIGIYLGLEGGLSSDITERAVTLTLDLPGPGERRAFWDTALGRHEARDRAALAARFLLPGGYIRQVAEIAVAHAALESHDMIEDDDVRQAARTLNRQLLDTLADYQDSKGDWSFLVANRQTHDKLSELERRCCHRERLLGHLGPAFGSNANRGVRALLTGASGTGKTLAARILANVLGMDLYRVDLAAIINKYIGETEKNLHRVLSRAEALDVILLLDEGDALLGQRTDVKSANDRYANLETNYLLQRLENYQGIVLVTTNLVDNIDKAFQRRMDVVVPFFAPQMTERLNILYLHLPENHQVPQSYLELVAQRCALSGGQIRQAALHAALVALDDGGPVDAQHLETALRSEFRKAGATFPLSSIAPLRAADGGMGNLVAAMAER